MRFLIACSGKGTRWKNYLGVPKHLIKIDGERLLDRTIRLIKERVHAKHDIWVIAFDDLIDTKSKEPR